jgi:hypothetical protein
MPSIVACRQKPASPMLSNATLNHCDSTNTCADHNGELAAITAAATTPTIAATRMGCVRGPETTSAYRAERTSRVASCSRPNAAPVTKPNAPQNTPNTEKPAGSRSRAARYSTAYPHSAVSTVAVPTRVTLARVIGPDGDVGAPPACGGPLARRGSNGVAASVTTGLPGRAL